MNETPPIPIEEIPARKTYAPWVGVVMAWFIPGSVHFLLGNRLAGIAWFFILLGFSVALLFLCGMPGMISLGFFLTCMALCLASTVVMLVSSYRPVRHLGWGGWLLFLLLWWFVSSNAGMFVVRYLVVPYVSETFVTSGRAMAPTLFGPSHENENITRRPDRIFVNKWIYRFEEPRRSDIVVYRTTTPSGEPTVYVMRLVGLPGEAVDIESPYILIDGKRVIEPPIFETMAGKRSGYSGYVSLQEIGMFDANRDVRLPITLGPDEYFVMGDNSERSLDSRMRGPVKRKDILGKAIRIYWPPNRFGDLE